MKNLEIRAFVSIILLFIVIAALLFLPAGTIRYWQAWIFLAVFFSLSFAITAYLAKNDPKLLERRMHGGPVNPFTAATVEIHKDQKVISIGPYAWVRHPMYFGGLLYLSGMPLALGSFWGFIVFLPLIPVLIWRLFDEEKLLAKDLLGYVEYQAKVKYRLVPFIW